MGMTGQDRTGQDRTGQDRTGQDRTEQNRAEQNGTERDGTKHTPKTPATQFAFTSTNFLYTLPPYIYLTYGAIEAKPGGLAQTVRPDFLDLALFAVVSAPAQRLRGLPAPHGFSCK